MSSVPSTDASYDAILQTARNTFLDLGVDHLSPSHLGAFLECPMQWAASYVLGLRTPPNANMEVGKLAEKVVVVAVKAGLAAAESKPLPLAETEELARFQYQGTFPLSDDDFKRAAHYAKAGIDAFSEHFGLSQFVWPRTEKQFWTSWHPEWSPLPIIGFMDFVSIHGEIVEMKTAKAQPAHAQAKYLHAWQAAVYWNALQLTGSLQEIIDWHPRAYVLYALARKKESYLVCPIVDMSALTDHIRNAVIRLSRFVAGHNPVGTIKAKRQIQTSIVQSVPMDRGHFRLNSYSPPVLGALEEGNVVEAITIHQKREDIPW